jgi:hypothetical protein
MELDEILALDRELTDEELALLERQLLITARALHRNTEELVREASKVEPELAERLRASTVSVLRNIELANANGRGGVTDA